MGNKTRFSDNKILVHYTYICRYMHMKQIKVNATFRVFPVNGYSYSAFTFKLTRGKLPAP